MNREDGKTIALNRAVNSPEGKTAIYARHETFHLRYGWLKKGFDKASLDPSIFNRENATVSLGVGKNMVKAIKYWCAAFKVIDEKRLPKNQGFSYQPSLFGHYLLGEEGWDPFLEDLASLWLLHWNLLKQPCQATAWHVAFNVFNKSMFTPDDLLVAMQEYNSKVLLTGKVMESSIKKDIHCLLRMYCDQRPAKGFREESIDSPLSELKLIRSYGDSRYFVFNMGKKPGLAPEIIVAACLEYANAIEQSAKTISLSRLLYEPGSPGTAFKLSENVLHEAIETVAQQRKDISLSETAGLVQLSFTEDPLVLADKLLKNYYGRRGN